MKILHLANTTLAGAPGMLAEATRQYSDHSTALIQFNDQGSERYVFQPNVFYFETNDWSRAVLDTHIEQADVIHIHNLLPVSILGHLAAQDLTQKTLVYQVHSPLFEPPNFGDVADDHGLAFDHKLVIGHFHPRQFPDYRIVPNCLFRQNLFGTFDPVAHDKVRVVTSPSTQSGRRWSAKVSPQVNRQLEALQSNPDLEVMSYSGMPPEMLTLHRHHSDISIDEVVTGSYHLVSYEGMACGNAVVNGCDPLALFALQAAFRTEDTPPFVICGETTLSNTINDLARDRGELARIKALSREFFWDVMAPEKVVKIFLDIYNS